MVKKKSQETIPLDFFYKLCYNINIKKKTYVTNTL